MILIFQLHPDHGRHIAYSPQEAKSNIENGWETVTKEQFYGVIKEVKEQTLRDVLNELYAEKFGKEPDKRKSDATIQAELDADNP